jgi:hypothetical protein
MIRQFLRKNRQKEMIFLEATAKRNILPKALIVTFVALIFIVALPMAVYAAAVTNFSADRTQVNQNQTITFSITTTAHVNHVWTMVGSTRVNATNISGNNWSLTITPTANMNNVTVYANSTNTRAGAAVFSIPINVTTAQQTPVTVAPIVPPAPANLAPMAIASVTETPAIAANSIQLTVVTGAGVNEVWAHFDRHQGEGRFARATMASQDANSRTWVLNFTPRAWAVQTVQVGANRTYDWPGATLRDHALTLAQPFVPPVNPTITNVTVANRTVATGANATFTIRTNTDVNNVWVRNVDGAETNATRTTDTANARNWTVSFNPQRSGTVAIYANATRTTTGAARRTETITVGHTSATISAANANWTTGTQVTISATTNNAAQSVWAVLPNGQRVQLNQTTAAATTGNRTWSTTANNIAHGGTITVFASGISGNIQTLTGDDSRTAVWGTQVGTGIITNVQPHALAVARGGMISFTVRTLPGVTLQASGGTHATAFASTPTTITATGEQEWLVQFFIHNTKPIGASTNQLAVQAFVGGTLVQTQFLTTTITG